MRLAPEGIPFVLAGATLSAAFTVLAFASGGLWWAAAGACAPVALWIPWFFRDPRRTGPRGDRLVLAPADGKIVSIANVEESEYIRGPAWRVSVFMNVLDVHVNRHPIQGTVRYRHYRPGAFINATLDKASGDNERMSLGVEGLHGRVLIRQIAGLIARRIVTDPHEGDEVDQGARLGLIRFGSRVETFLPLSTRICVGVGERTRAGVTVIAEWT